jgi:hypothetical protein
MTHGRNVPRVVLGIKPSGKPRRYQERNGAAYGRSLMQTEQKTEKQLSKHCFHEVVSNHPLFMYCHNRFDLTRKLVPWK